MSPPPSGVTPTPLGPPIAGRDVARTVVLALALFGLAFLAVGQLWAGSTTSGARINYLIARLAIWCFALLAAVWYVFVRGRGLKFADLGYTVPERKWAGRGVLFAFGAVPLAHMLLLLLRPTLDAKGGINVQQYFGGPDFTIVHAGTLLLYGGFLVPLAEELLFRGLLYRWLRQRFDVWPAALISAAVFGIAHVRFEQAVVAGLLGLPLAWLYERSRSLATAILMHQTYNSLLLMMTFAVIWIPQPAQG